MTTQTRIHLQPLKASNLPQHPDLKSKQGSAVDVKEFITEVLNEGQTFMTKTLEEDFQDKGTRNDAPATGPIKIRSYVRKPEKMPQENWFARTSEHENIANKDGTATWEEFDGYLRVNHSDNEKTYTPSVQEARLEYSWKEELTAFQGQIGEWQEVTMEIRSMQHKIPAPLNDRLFRVLVITAKRDKSFIVVQIPVDDDVPELHKPTPAPKVVKGIYCSVETGTLSEDGSRTTW